MGKTNSTSSALTESQFWGLLAKARRRGATSACDCCLKRYLNKLSNEEISDFGLMLYEKICDLNEWRIWGAGEVMMPQMSGDSFHYFRTWIVGVGKRAFDTARIDPDALGTFVDWTEDPIDIDNEAIEYVAQEILRERGLELDPRERSSSSADDEPRGVAFDPETVQSAYPKLAALMRGRPKRGRSAESREAVLGAVKLFAVRYTLAWCSSKPAAVAAHFAPQGILTINGGTPAIGREAITETVRSFMTAFPDLRVMMDRVVQAGERVEYHWTLTGTNTGPCGSGRRVCISGYESWLLSTDDLILDSQGHFDAEDYSRQLAGAPPDAQLR